MACAFGLATAGAYFARGKAHSLLYPRRLGQDDFP